MQEMTGIEARDWVLAGKSLPNNLVVEGDLNLFGCTALTTLPDNLVVNGRLYLTNCTALTGLPDNLVVNGSLYLWGFTNLTSSVRWLFPKSALKCEYSPIGYIQDDGTLLIRAGCFSGTLEESRIRSKERIEYLKAINDIEEEWKVRNKKTK